MTLHDLPSCLEQAHTAFCPQKPGTQLHTLLSFGIIRKSSGMDEQGEGLWMSPKMGTCGLCQVNVNQRAFVWAEV